MSTIRRWGVAPLLALGVACGDDASPSLRAVGRPCTPTERPNGLPCAPGATPPETRGCFVGGEVYAEAGNPDCGGGICLVNRYDEAADRDGSARDLRMHCTCTCGPSLAFGGRRMEAECRCPEGTVCQEFQGAGHTYASYCVRVRP